MPRCARFTLTATDLDAPLLRYPCRFPVKAFLRPDPATEEVLIARVRAELDADAPLEVARRPSRNAAWLCLTLAFEARDADHAQRVGAAVHDTPGVMLSI